MSHQSFSWQSQAAAKVEGLHWPSEQPRAAVCIIHGMGEHIGRYHHVADFLHRHGIATAGIDLPGFGRSGGARGHSDLPSLLSQIELLVRRMQEWHPGIPVFLFGQSMGGNLVLNYLFDKRSAISGVIASSPWIRLPAQPSPWLIGFAQVMSRIMPALTKANGLDTGELSSDPAVEAAYRADPLVHDRVSMALGLSMLKGAHRLDRQAGHSPAPLLLMHGSRDRLTDPIATEALAGRLVGDVSLKIWPGMKHELHNEPGKAEVMSQFVKWMESNLNV
jgi:alpha-beta hydrolase superfamily lysophospholipase